MWALHRSADRHVEAGERVNDLRIAGGRDDGYCLMETRGGITGRHCGNGRYQRFANSNVCCVNAPLSLGLRGCEEKGFDDDCLDALKRTYYFSPGIG